MMRYGDNPYIRLLVPVQKDAAPSGGDTLAAAAEGVITAAGTGASVASLSPVAGVGLGAVAGARKLTGELERQRSASLDDVLEELRSHRSMLAHIAKFAAGSPQRTLRDLRISGTGTTISLQPLPQGMRVHSLVAASSSQAMLAINNRAIPFNGLLALPAPLDWLLEQGDTPTVTQQANGACFLAIIGRWEGD